MDVLGVDVEGVIIQRGNNRNSAVPLAEYLKRPAIPGAFDALKQLVTHGFNPEYIHLVPKSSEQTEENITVWLDKQGFFGYTGISREHMAFCRRSVTKAHMCRKLKITHFVDDRLQVLGELYQSVPTIKNLYLLNPAVEEVAAHSQYQKKVIWFNDWSHLCNELRRPQKTFQQA